MSQVVVITGASSGIGRATAHRFAREGASLGLIARDPFALEETAREVRAFGGCAVCLPLDVSNPEAIEGAADLVEKELGPIDVWINAAIVSMYSPIAEMEPQEVRRITEVGYLGSVFATQAALRRMLTRDRGTIIVVGSGLGYRAVPLQSAYCAVKFALRGFVESLQAELHHSKSHVNVCYVAPSSVNTPYYSWARSKMLNRPNAVPPVYQPEVVAGAIHWLVQHPRRELAIGFTAALARQGSRVSPALTDWLFGRIGYRLQQTETPNSPFLPDNMFKPIDGHAVHGEFDHGAKEGSAQLALTTHRRSIAILFCGAVGAALLLRRRVLR